MNLHKNILSRTDIVNYKIETIKYSCQASHNFFRPVTISSFKCSGDESENHEQTFCGRCNVRYNSKDPCGATDIPSPLYTMKSRRSREVKSPTIYEVPEQSQDKLSTDYPRSLSRYQRKLTDAYTEKLKRSLHTSHGTARTSFRHVE